jgi:two-component system CheB/CheR fusion protein
VSTRVRRRAPARARQQRSEPDVPPIPDVYQLLFERSVSGIALHEIVLDEAGRPVDYVFLQVNAAFERQTGLARAAVLGRRVTEVLPGIERDPAGWIGRYGRVALGGGPDSFQQYSTVLERWYDVAAFSPARGFFAVVFSDVTEHRRLQEALRDSERRYRVRSSELAAVLDATHAQLALLDTELRFVLVNDAYERACGHRREALVGRGHFELFANEENERIFRRVLETGEPFYVEEKPFEFPDQPGRGVTWWNWSLVPVRGDGGRIEGVLLSLLDVTGQVAARKAVEDLASERKRSEDALRELDRRKTEFLAVLSHELRNPLAPMQNALWLLDRDGGTGEQATRARRIIGRQVRHLGRIVDDLLDVTRVVHGKIRLQKVRLDLVDLVRRTLEDHADLLSDRGIMVEERLGAEPLWVEADPTRIAQAVGNLLHNAAKFTARGARVEVALERDGAAAALRVRDEGVGIAPHLLPRLFEPFTQADESLDRNPGGLGLGLSLVKGFVELHGGTVEARSAGLGKGTELVVRLPALAAQPAPPGLFRRGPTARPRRVLVVEDNADAADTLREMLELWGHLVDVARDGADGVARARAFRPEVVLCDIGLPAMNGYEVARAIRADPAIARTFLVAVTGYATDEDRRLASEAGFDRHLGKPVQADQIAELVASAPTMAR